MKILFDGRPITRENTSGIPEYAKLLFAELVRGKNEGDRYTLFFNSFSRRELPDDFKDLDFEIMNWGVPNKLIEASSRFFGVPRVGKRECVDVVVRPHFHPLRVSRGTRDVVVFHDLSFVRFPEYFSRKKNAWHRFQDPKSQARRADRIIAVSRATQEDLVRHYGISPEKISVVHSGINDFFRAHVEEAALEEFLQEHGIEGRYILSVGTLEPRKNVDGIIRAFSIIKQHEGFEDVKLIIVGARGWLYDTILKEASLSRFSSDIRMWGHASFEALRFLYRGACVFVYPSFFEGFGFPPLEAQACGVPVVASSRGSLGEILEDSALFVDPEKDGDIAHGIEAMLENTLLREEFQKKGIENEKRFQWKTTAGNIKRIIEDLS